MEQTILGALGIQSAGTTTPWEVAQTTLASVAKDFADGAATVISQLEQLGSVVQLQSNAVSENTLAVVSSVASKTGGGAGEIAQSAAKSLLGGAGLVSLVSGIVGLFTGGGNSEPAALAEYTAPPPVDFEGASAAWQGQPIRATSYDQYGLPRAQNATAPFFAPAITIQVQAMDSRSFLDHSDDIAMAVREAILNGHALGGVMSET
jgi:hypothetical protein